MKLGSFWRVPLRTGGLPGRVNCWVVGERALAIVDPGSSFPGELDRIRRCVHELLGRGGEARLVFCTHHHPDHTAGAHVLSEELGVPIAGHPATLDRLPPRRRRADLLPLADGARIDLGAGLRLDVLHTPGHADGHLCLFEPDARILVGGDMVPGRGTTLVDDAEGSMSTYLASLRRLAALEPEHLLPAHGPPRTGASRVIGELYAHRLWREQRVLASLDDAPRSCGEITRLAYSDLAGARIALAYHSTLAHLHKLEHEGLARRRGEDAWSR